MVKLNSEMKNAFSKMRIFPLATASKDGVPNVIPIGFCKLQDDDETVWIADNFFLKTLDNLRENPRVALYVWGPETQGCFQIKGPIEIKRVVRITKKCTRWSSPWVTGSLPKALWS